MFEALESYLGVVTVTHSHLVKAYLKTPLRALSLIVEEVEPGEFRWRILERHGKALLFESVSYSDSNFAAYDAALATGYGELQRLVGPDLQYGPRKNISSKQDISSEVTEQDITSSETMSLKRRPINNHVFKSNTAAL